VVYQHLVFKLVIGIAMGTYCAPDQANIYLRVFESNYIHSLVTTCDLDLAAKLSNMLRIQDDLIVFEDNGLFETNYNRNIYPSVMELKNTNLRVNKVNYLDMTINIQRGRYFYKSFDKRNDFGFEVNYSNLSGNKYH